MVDRKPIISALTPSPSEKNFPTWLTNYKDEKTGTVIIPYSLDPPEPFGGAEADDREESTPFSKAQREALLRHMDHIERIANVKFRDVNQEPKGVTPDEPRLLFFQTRPINEEKWRQTQADGFPGGWIENLGKIEDPKMNVHISSRYFTGDDTLFEPEKFGSYVILHELLHGLGLTHPFGVGDTPGYAEVSVMSYENHQNKIHKMRFGDEQKLVDMWGESLREDSIWNTNTIAPGPMREDFLIPENGNAITINLQDSTETRLVNLNLRVDTEKGSYPASGIQIAKGVNIKEIIGPDTAALVFYGDAGSTKVTGGSQADSFYLGAGANTLTGNGGSDMYVFGTDSGTSHVVTDFTAEDGLFLKKNVREITLHFIERENGAAALEVATESSLLRLESNDIKEFDNLLRKIVKDGKIQISGKTTEDDTKLLQPKEEAELKPTETPTVEEQNKDKTGPKR